MTIQERKEVLQRLEEHFKTVTLPAEPVKLGGYMTFHNIRTYIATNLTSGYSEIENGRAEICIDHLEQLAVFLNNHAQEKEATS